MSEASSKNPSTINEASADGASRSLRKAFRSYASSLIVAARQAEKMVVATAATVQKGKDDTKAKGSATEAEKKDADPLHASVQQILKHKQLVRRTATLLEDQLRGNVKESEALQCTLKSQPCIVGGRKRKFSTLDKSS